MTPRHSVALTPAWTYVLAMYSIFEPFDTAAAAAAAARGAVAGCARRRPGDRRSANVRLLFKSTEWTGIELGAYDRQSLTRLADALPLELCAVLAGVITRAYDQGGDDADAQRG